MVCFTYFWYHIFWEALDWIYPPSCGGCGSMGVRWCTNCESSLVQIREDVCSICGYPYGNRNICEKCFRSKPSYTQLRSIYRYQTSIRRSLHQLKYKNDLGFGEILGQKCAEFLKSLEWSIDIITPVPLGKRRRKERGYNQAALIAYPIALLLKTPYKSKLLERVKETHSQIDFSAEQRKENMQNAFIAISTGLRGKNILIVDDVITTGSTMDSCAKALKKAGAKNVYGLSVARTMIETDLT